MFSNVKPIEITIPNIDTFQFALLGEISTVRRYLRETAHVPSTRSDNLRDQLEACVETNSYILLSCLRNPELIGFDLTNPQVARDTTFTLRVNPGYELLNVTDDEQALIARAELTMDDINTSALYTIGTDSDEDAFDDLDI
jgi:hypothetical protein